MTARTRRLLNKDRWRGSVSRCCGLRRRRARRCERARRGCKVAGGLERGRRGLGWGRLCVKYRVRTQPLSVGCSPRAQSRQNVGASNGLLHQYFPKGTDLARWSADDLAAVAANINNRPREVLGRKTPAEVFNQHLQSQQQAGVATID